MIMSPRITLCFVCLFGFFYAKAQEERIASLKEIKAGSVFIKPGVGAFFKTGRIADDLLPPVEELVRQFRNGFVWTLDGAVMISSKDYIGATFARTSKLGTISNTISVPGGSIFFSIDNTETIQYLGAYYGNMQNLNRKGNLYWHSRAGLGIFTYQSKVTNSISGNLEFKESNIGFQVGTGLEVRIANAISWVVDVDLLTGNVKIEDERENLSQIRTTSGLMLRF